MQKLCKKCGETKDLDLFAKHPTCKLGRDSQCKACRYTTHREWIRNNKDKHREMMRNNYLSHKEHRNVKSKEWKENNKEEYRDQQTKYIRERRRTNVQARLGSRLRSRLNTFLLGHLKVGSAVRDLGCSLAELRVHLESRFADGMSWSNHGKGPGTWQIHHIKPLHTFDLTNREEFKLAVHHSNLTPVWYEEHVRIHHEMCSINP